MSLFKKIFLLFILLIEVSLAQYSVEKIQYDNQIFKGKIVFEEPRSEIIKKGNETYIKYDEFSLSSEPGIPALPFKIVYVALPPAAKISFKLMNNSYTKIDNVIPQANYKVNLIKDSLITYETSELDLSEINGDVFPENEYEIIGYKWLKDNYVAIVQINTHRFNWRKREISILQSCDFEVKYDKMSPVFPVPNKTNLIDKEIEKLVINPEQARIWRSKNPNIAMEDSSGDWIDFSKEYVKIGIIKDGIQRLTYFDLQNIGIDLSVINPKTLKIFQKGKEIPISIYGENDESFDSGDFIEFYAEKNYGNKNYTEIVPYAVDYLNYMDRYNDTSHVWLTWGGSNGERVFVDSTNLTAFDTINFSIVNLHQEKDVRLWYYDAVSARTNLPFWQENKVWTWQLIGNSGNKTFNFYAYNFVPNSDVKITTRLISNAANITINAHKIGSSLNSNSPQDTVDFDYKKTVNFTTTFNSNNLLNGKNTYRIFGLPSSASFHQTLIDWVDIQYERENVALKDSMLITVPDGFSSALRAIKISNIAADSNQLTVYKIAPRLKKLTEFSLTNTKILTFVDTVSSGDKFLVVSNDFIIKPKIILAKTFENIRVNNNGADYIIISNRVLESSSKEYADYIKNQYGLRVGLYYVDDIYDEFNYGNPSAECIKEFIRLAYSSWPAPQPLYLLLIGDANYDYKDVLEPAPQIRKKNLVPSYGMPVSDVWYTTLDSSNQNFQNMLVGRIPANTNEEVLNYLNKHKIYKNRNFDDWNKRYLLFSGGDPTKSSELAQIKSTNDFIMNEYVNAKPVGGYSKHFYKTINPVTNFGPVTQEEFQNEIDKGGMFISYIGHSGTQTWDNGITDVRDLKTKTNDRFPLITDFGCSTGRFAEPDVNAFSELFIAQSVDGQAINYLGNSSFGYLSTSLNFPKIFYKALLKDSILTLGQAHFYSKNQLFLNSGLGDINRVFNFCNLLFGDPIIEFALPKLPNLRFAENKIELQESNPTDQSDSVMVKFVIENLGSVNEDSLNISIADEYNSQKSFEKIFAVQLPVYQKEILINIPIKNLTGEHKLRIQLDVTEEINEIYENDNVADFSFNVFPSSVRNIINDNYYAVVNDTLRILNPMQSVDVPKIILQFSEDEQFASPSEIIKDFDTLSSVIDLSQLKKEQRYWYRSKLEEQSEWSNINSFVNSQKSYNWKVDYHVKNKDILNVNTFVDSSLSVIKLISKYKFLKITSAGFNDGFFASVTIDGEEKLPNTFFWGIATALLDSTTLEPKEIKYFVYPSSTSAPALIEYLQSLPVGANLVLTICNDGAQSVLGYTGGTAVRNEIKNFGSALIDNVRYRESWCMIGKKGAPTGSVPEVHKKLFEGMAIIDSSVAVIADSGSIVFPRIKKSSKWISVAKDDSIPAGSRIIYNPLGIRADGGIDTLSSLDFVNNHADISFVDATKYNELYLSAKLFSNELKESPEIRSLSVNYETLPELGVNYQTVRAENDSIDQGKEYTMSFKVMNVGEVDSDSFNVKANLLIKNNFVKTLLDTNLTMLGVGDSKEFEVRYLSSLEDGYGDSKINIIVDGDNKVREFYEDNNFYEQSFYIIKDTVTSITSAKMNVYFDEREIVDGDYVQSKPEIKFELNYQSQFPYNDTTAVRFYMDNKMIYYSAFKNINYDTIKRTVTFFYNPTIESGLHELRVVGDEIIGNIEGQSGYFVNFNVSNESKILAAYNYPNPIRSTTDFTFTLTQEPDEVSIRIYTIAGRMIKEIKTNSASINFNKVQWDTRDQDGDLVANGVYLYKIIVKKNGKSDSITQKLAVLR